MAVAKKKITKSPVKDKKAKPAEKKSPKVKKSVTQEKTQLDVVVPGIEKQEIIAQYQVKTGDTGSPEVQIALLAKRMDKLVVHLKTNPQDNHSRRGLLGIVSKRRRLLNYLEKKDPKRYKEIISKLGLK